MDQSQDLLLALTGSSFSLNPQAAMPEKTQSFNKLVNELFNHESDAETMQIDIMKDFADDGEIAEDKLFQTAEQQKSLQVFQQPEALKEGITKESGPYLPREILPHLHEPQGTPALAVFRIGSSQEKETTFVDLDQLLELDTSSIEVLLSTGCSQVSLVSPTVEHAQPEELVDLGDIQPHIVYLETSLVTETPAIDTSDSVELDNQVKFIQDAVERYHSSGAAVCSNGKMQVHEVVLVLLLAPAGSGVSGILVFCNQEGYELSQTSNNFKAKDTRTMGQIWQKVKHNKTASYDIFARAMRVGRERGKGYFEYLDAGKAARKRVYKLGAKCLKEMERMRRVLGF